MIRQTGFVFAKAVARRPPKFNQDLRHRDWQALSRTDIKRHVRPAPSINEKPDGGVRLDLRIARYAGFLPITEKLSADDVGGTKWTNRLEDTCFLIANGIGTIARRRIHR